MMSQLTLRSGGQTGVDRAAIDLALRHRQPYCGWCPLGGWADDFPAPPGVLTKYPNLTETPKAALEQRSAWNVRDSQATIILVRDEAELSFPGVAFTWLCAELIFSKPCLVVHLTHADIVAPARDWLARNIAAANEPNFVLNVAGPRESAAPGIYLQATQFLNDLLA